MRVMDRRGPAQATVTDVADALGISRRTVYNYFASTEQLFTAVAELALQGFVADVKSKHLPSCAEGLAAFLACGRVAVGGDHDVENKYIAPTVLVDVGLGEAVMREEIFGPILPIVVVSNHREAISVINSRAKPLALYAYTRERTVRRDLLEQIASGGLVFGAAMVQLRVPDLPFGGVGPSGAGAYHGQHTVRTFSHERAIFRKLAGPHLAAMAHPPHCPKREADSAPVSAILWVR
jgi:acyl-CoA reductase-like NAD-dependent aldehyde dehydrogenase